MLTARVIDNMTDTAAADLVRAEGLAAQALAAAPQSSLPHLPMGQVRRAQYRYAEAIPEYEAALSLNHPNRIVVDPDRKLACAHSVAGAYL